MLQIFGGKFSMFFNTINIISMLQETCYDTDNGHKDIDGNGCDFYQLNVAIGICNNGHIMNDEDFDSNVMCCVCGGGTSGNRLCRVKMLATRKIFKLLYLIVKAYVNPNLTNFHTQYNAKTKLLGVNRQTQIVKRITLKETVRSIVGCALVRIKNSIFFHGKRIQNITHYDFKLLIFISFNFDLESGSSKLPKHSPLANKIILISLMFSILTGIMKQI